ncbi:MAG TPA: CapA family protein [Chloroflexota bacterium]|nr:CapA family protein [Chloroflexota bacterium]
MTPFSIAAVGDVALLNRPGAALFRTGWDDADLRLANLEAPLCEGGIPAAKLIRLQSPLQAAEWLRDDLRCDAVSLANNHIMDWGQPGLDSTLSALDRTGIAYAGAGATNSVAGTHRLLTVNGSTVAFLSWACTVPVGFRANAQHAGLAAVRVRTSYAADALLIDEQPGTPPWVHTETWSDDVAALEQALGAARAAADFVVLALHWGVPPQWQSNFQGPLAEYQETLAPRLVAAGADLVLGHHAHTVYGVQAFARPAGSPGLVCYSLGNYIFHPLAQPRPLPLDAPSRPYHAPERPENRDSFVGVFTIDQGVDGRLAVCEARLHTSILDHSWEARPAPADATRQVVERLQAFSAWRETTTQIMDGALVWRP